MTVDHSACWDARVEIRNRVLAARALSSKSSLEGAEFAGADADTQRLARTLQLVSELTGSAPPSAMTVASYLSTGTEPDSLRLVAALEARKYRILVPLLSEIPQRHSEPDWAEYLGAANLRPGRFAIPQPFVGGAPAPGLGAAALASAHVIVVSALAASPEGGRIGTGGGWYDRALVHASPDAHRIALVNDDEVMPVPQFPHDLPVHWIVTPIRTIRSTFRIGL